MKKILASVAVLASLLAAGTAFAATPTLTLSIDPNNTSLVELNVTGDPNASVILDYYATGASGPQLTSLGATNAAGSFSTEIGLTDYSIVSQSSVSVLVNNQQSAAVLWPYASSATGLSLSQSSVVVPVSQSSTVTASGASGALYLAGNTSPQTANISVSGNQVTVTGVSQGQTTANICTAATGGATSYCASLSVIVQNSSSQTLSFSQNNVSILSGQNVQISISGGNGFYQLQNNSNPSVMSATFNGPTMTVYGNGSSGTSTLTVCSSDMSACGVVTAAIGAYNSAGLSFSQTNPYVLTNQTASVTISGGYGTYTVSSNSNTGIVQTYVSNNTLTLYGNTPGSATVTVCSSSGACGNLYVTVSGASGGAITLSQSTLSLSAGQSSSVTVSGGTAPYSLVGNTASGVAQFSLANNLVTVTGTSAGSASASVCSAGGACVTLAVTVGGANTVATGVQPVFSQNNFSLAAGQSTSVSLSGAGGYYVSNNTNPASVSAAVSGSTLVVAGLAAGSASISVCQTGGQCNMLYATVGAAVTTVAATSPVTFTPSAASVAAGSSVNVYAAGGAAVGYYVSAISNRSVASVYVDGSRLIVNGLAAGSASVSVCSSSGSCASFSVSVSGSTAAASSGYVFSTPLDYGSTGAAVTKLQQKLTSLGVYTGPITGYYGTLTEAAVKVLQGKYGVAQLGNVGPATRALLNRL